MRREVSPKTVTSGIRIMVPTLTAAALLLAAIYLFQPDSRTSGPAFDAPKLALTMRQWGLLFLTTGLVKLTGMLAQDRRILVTGLCCGGVLFATWTGFIFASAAQSDIVSWSSPVIIAIVVVAHTAVIYSLVRDRIV